MCATRRDAGCSSAVPSCSDPDGSFHCTSCFLRHPLCRIAGLDSSFELIGSPQRRQGKSSLSCSGEEDADFPVSEVQAGE